jgi:glycosyltransferase involved in cell wall biosynthesis
MIAADTRRAAPRLLMLGTVNHPHVEHLALAMADRGFAVTVGGDAVDALAPSVLPAAGIELRSAPAARRGSAAGAAGHVRWIRGLLRELDPDVVHAHWLCGFAFFAALAGAKPLVAMAWGSDVLRARASQRLANRIAVRRSALVLGDSRLLLERLVALGASPERCVLVKWGVDLDTFRPVGADERAALRRELGLGGGRVVLSPRSLLPVYNQPTIVSAWAQVASERDDVQLVLKHMGVEGEDLGALPFPERVHLVGHVEYERMAAYYRAADVCVSLASSDSAPRSVFEAMACGVPCVVSDLPWVHEQIGDRREALIVPIERGAVVEAFRQLLDDRELAAGIGMRGRRLVEDRLDRRVHMDRLAAVYRSLLRGQFGMTTR